MYECNYFYTASSSQQIASSTCNIATTTPATIATTSDILIVPTMTAGEVLTSFMLFVLIIVLLTRYMLGALDRVKTRKNYMAYSGGDVEIRDDI